MPSEFAEMGVRFEYPENWTVSKETGRSDCRSVTVTSPQGAFWTLSIHSRTTDPSRLLKVAVQAMREEYKDLEISEFQEEVHGHQLAGRELNFFYLDLTNTACIRAVRTDLATYTVFCQAEDREFERIQEVFRAMTDSFLANAVVRSP
ncbi:MAG TPA: hypothetical protein VJL29_06595 [Thermoguttaceae bacterium]|nr:hypothetical protein [Thermoguttaceae bacterium]